MLEKILNMNVKKPTSQVIDDARMELNEIGAVFLSTIQNYRNHSQKAQVQAEAYQQEAADLEQKAADMRLVAAKLKEVSNQADNLALNIEKSIGGSEYLEMSA